MRLKLVLLAILLTLHPFFIFAADLYKAKSDLNVRTGPGTKYPIVLTLQKGDEVKVLSKNGSWCQLEYSGKVGYARSSYLRKTSGASSNEGFDFQILYIILLLIAVWAFKRWRFEVRRKQRRDYYRNEYLKSPEWQRKRHMVLQRDNWRCVYCGAPATQVHHKRYAKRNIGNEPISWLVSICKSCHESIHD